MNQRIDDFSIEQRNKFSVNVIFTDPCESNEEPLQFSPPVINSLEPKRNRRSCTDVSDVFYKEKLRALSKIKELQQAALNLDKKILAQENSFRDSGDQDLIKKAREKIGLATKKKEKGLCNCNQSCALF